VEINLAEEQFFRDAFVGDLNVDELIKKITGLDKEGKFKFIPFKTCLFFDEIQDCPRARSAIKPIVLDGRFDVICSGSLLGIINNKKVPSKYTGSIPVGYEDIQIMHPMDFEEFL
jgi:predicted AAA+ superfamily ATPase